MKTNIFSKTLALTMVLIFGGAITCAAQTSNNCPYQQFGLNSDLSNYLGLTTAQIDGINKNLILLNYDWCEAKNSTALLDEQIAALENDSTQTPTSIGLSAGSYVQQKVTIARAIIAEVIASNKTLAAMLTTAQQQKLAAVQVSVQNANAIYSISGDAFYGNLYLSQYSVVSFDPNGGNMSYPASPQTATVALTQTFATAVQETLAQRSKDRALAARQARLLPMTERR